MDRRERAGDLNETLLAMFDGQQANIWTALPAIIQSFDPVAMTVSAQPALQGIVRDQYGNFSNMNLPMLVDVPVCFPGGGGFTLTFPVAQGDEALVVFSSRCIDAWWQLGGVQVQSEMRMHDMSDGFALVGVRSQPRVLSGINTTGTQLRSDDGLTYVEVDSGTIKLKAPTSVTIDTPLTTITGDLVVQGKATITKLFTYLAGLAGFAGSGANTISGGLNNTGGTVSSNGKILETHTHSGVQTGSGNTGAPN